MLASLSKGGHLRVGMEDVLTISRGVPVESNAQLVERAVAIGALAQRTPMSPAEARELIGVRAALGVTASRSSATGCLAARLPVALRAWSRTAYSYLVYSP